MYDSEDSTKCFDLSTRQVEFMIGIMRMTTKNDGSACVTIMMVKWGVEKENS